MDISRERLEELLVKVLEEKFHDFVEGASARACVRGGIMSVKVPAFHVGEENQLDTGNPSDRVYTKDLFSLKESPRLGCGIMEMERTTFEWNLDYDEIDYVIEGTLEVISGAEKVRADAGEIILIPKGSRISFSVPEKARFLYVTYPANWQGAGA